MSGYFWEISKPPGNGPQVAWINGDEVLRLRYSDLFCPKAMQFYRPARAINEKLMPAASSVQDLQVRVDSKESPYGEETRNDAAIKRDDHSRTGSEALLKRIYEAHSLLRALVDDYGSSEWWMSNSCWLHVDSKSDGIQKLGLNSRTNSLTLSDDHAKLRHTYPMHRIDLPEDWAALLAVKSIVKPKFKWLPPAQLAKQNMFLETNKYHDKIVSGPDVDHGENVAAGQETRQQAVSGSCTEESNSPGRLGCSRDLFNTVHSNPKLTPAIACAHEATVVIPSNCDFLVSDLGAFRHQARELTKSGKFNLIVLDPPWENKSVKRKRTYQTLPNWSLLELPMHELMHQDGCLVGLWVTNRLKHKKFTEQALFPLWGLKELTSWVWLKVDSSGRMLSDPMDEHHKPYEQIILACSGPRDAYHEVWKDVIIMSMPGEHSRKPPISELLSSQVAEKLNCLELFARELVPGWSSWGNEVLHFQGVDCLSANVGG